MGLYSVHCLLNYMRGICLLFIYGHPGHIYFHPVVYSSFFFFFLSSPNLSRRRLHVYHTCTHGVALVRI